MTDTQLNPPSSASVLYKTLHATALGMVNWPPAPGPSVAVDSVKMKALCSPDFQQSWGHHLFVSTKPQLSGKRDIDGFIDHLSFMLPRLESWDNKVTDIVVDEMKRTVVVRASYYMQAKGVQEKVENDLMWMLKMNEDGKKIVKSTEFLDGSAMERLAELMKGAEG